MGRTLAEILPLALGAAVSPTGLLFVMMVLSGGGNARRNALLFNAGAALFLAVLGLLVTTIFSTAVKSSSHSGGISAWIDIILAAAIFLIVARQMIFSRKSRERAPSGGREAGSRRGKRPYLMIGFAFMLVNASTMVLFIAGARIIAADTLAIWQNLALFVVLLFITMSLISLPVAISYAAPRSSRRLLAPIETFMSRHGSTLAAVVFMAVAVYLLIHGIARL